ncbi:olfactory receptor 1G1-like [Spea bombifrons]|uniref:olfactory receptor 1G1-like n=1 Tax=Spea bombifrons TaxID=233779 RepID=UPI002349DA74|nr:olfactory receptor 1G1-like [Spea bombifrons]
MERTNLTTDFTLLGFSDLGYHRAALFCVFLVIYVLTWTGNILLLSAIKVSPQLHTPMYYFLGNLSFVDICFSSVTLPKLLNGVLCGRTVISFLGCFLQLYFFVSLGITENFLLAVMAFDRCLAICNPLRYSILMSKTMQSGLVGGCWLLAALHSLLHTYTMSHLTFRDDRLIEHFFCDMTSLIKLSCSSAFVNELLIYIEGPVTIMVPFLLILVSYVLIARAIFKLKTSTGRSKAFSSCSSHLTMISLFCGTIIFIYFRPPSIYSPTYDRLVSIVYAVITPMLNPFIYSLRNQEVKNTLVKYISQYGTSLRKEK